MLRRAQRFNLESSPCLSKSTLGAITKSYELFQYLLSVGQSQDFSVNDFLFPALRLNFAM